VNAHKTAGNLPGSSEPRDLTAEFEAIRAEVNDALERRRNLFVTTQAQLIASGIDAAIVPVYKTHTSRPSQAVGDIVIVQNSYEIRDNGRMRLSCHANPHWNEHHRRFNDFWGVYDRGNMVLWDRGLYEVLVVEDDLALEAKVKRAIGRLRNRARTEHMRVQVRDRAITLISPMNDVVHEGDVNSAMLWLCGIDVTEVTA
jgi:hypothetical protein